VVVNEVEVSAFEPDRTVELTSISGPTPFVYRYRLEPSADGTILRLKVPFPARVSAERLCC
jgi:hypothetical protein